MNFKSGNVFVCSHCGFTGACYGVPFIGAQSGISAPYCQRCGRNDGLNELKDFDPEPIKFYLIPIYTFHVSKEWQFSAHKVSGLFSGGHELVFQWFIGPFRIDKWRKVKR